VKGCCAGSRGVMVQLRQRARHVLN
jgi:hypothetical protein